MLQSVLSWLAALLPACAHAWVQPLLSPSRSSQYFHLESFKRPLWTRPSSQRELMTLEKEEQGRSYDDTRGRYSFSKILIG